MEIEFERAAMRMEEMPDGLLLEDQLCFLCLRELYAQYRAKRITRERAAIEKQKVVREWSKGKQKFSSSVKLAEWAAVLWKSVEGAANSYAKDRTLENADRMYAAIYGMEMGEKARD